VGHGIINVDFADVRTIMLETGVALMGTGMATGESRAVEAAQKAISSPLLEDVSIEGARGLLINITGGPNMTLNEINEATTLIHKEAHEDANIIWGMVIDSTMQDELRVTVIATGFGKAEEKAVPATLAATTTATMGATTAATIARLKKIAPVSLNTKENRDIPAFLRRVKTNERYDEVKLDESTEISVEDEDRFDIPTFLRKQAD
jgi:cell division protein FtsZ